MASSTIGQLRVILGLDSAEFEKGTKKAGQSLTRFEKNMGTMRKSMGTLAKTAGTLGLALGAMFSVASIKRGLDYAAALSETSQQLGVTVEQLQIYRFAATQTGITQEEMDKGLAKLTKSLGEAALGAQKQAKVFGALGIAIKDTEGNVRSTGAIMLDLADKIAAIRNPAEQAAVATQLFGRAGQKLIPLLSQGSVGIKKFADEAQKLGIVMSSELADKADKASDRMALLNQQLSVKWSATVAENADSIMSMANALATLAGAIAKFWSQHPEKMIAILTGLVGLRFGGPIGGAVGLVGGLALGKEFTQALKDANQDVKVRKQELDKAMAAMATARKEAASAPSSWAIATGKARQPSRDTPTVKMATAELQRQLGLAREAAKAFDAAKVAASKTGGGIGGDLELGEFLGGGGGKGKGRKGDGGLAKAEEQLRKGLASMRETLQQGFDDINLPAATAKADELRRKLEELAESARESGVGVGKFSGEIAVLKTKIAELEATGLEEEAKDFTKAVEKQALAVSGFARGGLPELEEALSAVDDRYESLQQAIEDQIEENLVLAGSNATAARAMQLLQGQLGKLEEAHKRATEAAIAQHKAESAIADLQMQRQGQDIRQEIGQLQQDRGDFGPVSERQREMVRIEQDLSRTRIDAAITLRQMEAERDQAQRLGDAEQVTRLNRIIELQRTYYDEVTQTNAAQILAAQSAQDAWDEFEQGLSGALQDLVWDFDNGLKSLKRVFQQLINDLIVKPATDALAKSLGTFFSSLFAGGFAHGGVIPRGQWGIVGERGPEPIFAGKHDLTVMPNGGGQNLTINVTAPNTGNPKADRITSIQHAARIRTEVALASRRGY